jgi:RecB family exonuclease
MVNTLVDALREAYGKHRFANKKLIVDNLQGGHQLLEAAARSGEAWLNVTPVTPLQLAMELAEPELADKGIKLLSEGQMLNLLDEELAVMAEQGRLKYFAGLEGDEGLAGILMPAIIELRAAGLKAQELNSAYFVDPQKGLEIKDLLGAYEKRLQLEHLVDTADLYRNATDLLAKKPEVAGDILYLIPEQLEFSALEYDFIEACTKTSRIILPEEPLFEGDADRDGQVKPDLLKGLHFKAEIRSESEAEPYATGLAYLEDPKEAPDDTGIKIELSRAYGPANEVNDLLQKLLRDNVRLDQVRVCYSDASIYVPLFYTLAAQYGVPVTFGDGYTTAFTRPGKLLEGLLNWLADNFLVDHLSKLFYSDLIETNSPVYLVRALRKAKIGWGYERYLTCLAAAVQQVEADIEKQQGQLLQNPPPGGVSAASPATVPDVPDYLQLRLENAREALKLIEAIFAYLPQPGPAPENRVDFSGLCHGLARLIKDYTKVVSPDDAAAKESIIDALTDAALSYNDSLDLKAAVKRIRSRLSGLRINVSGSKPGHLHLSAISKGEWCPRPYTFIVGLQSGSFPGSGLQDPILLDQERQKISPHLSLKAPQPARNRMRLNRLLASCRGFLSLSYSSFSPVEARPTMPAASMLQVYRLVYKDPAADYTKLEEALVNQAIYYPAEPTAALFINQWWLYLALLDHKLALEPAAVGDCFPGLKAGFMAADQRRSSEFTSYDGQVAVDPLVVDPTQNHNLTLSASKLEKLGNCPFAYFVQNMLGVELPDEHEFSPGSWLDAPTRGHLFHQIYAEFMNKVKAKRLDSAKEIDLIKKIGCELIKERKAEVPPPSEVVYKYEKEGLLSELETFLKVESRLRQQDGYSPLYFEAPFGINNPDLIKKAGAGLIDPVEIMVSQGSTFRLRGVIDRIDQVPGDPPRFGVWDYKTGSTYGYDENQYLNKGRQLQHALYAIAAEKILEDAGRKSPEVSEGGYIFPTQKGEGRAYRRDQAKRPRLLSALGQIVELIKSGTFCVTEEDRCTFCDYQDLCRVKTAQHQIKTKLENPANSMLDPWKELQAYE